MTFNTLPGQSCSDVRDAADADRRAGRFAESLQKHEWLFEHSRNERGMGGVRLSFALSDWLELASDYQPAMVAFVSLRDRTEMRCRESQGDFEAFHELSALNSYLNLNQRTIAMFLEIAEADKNAAAHIYHVVEPLLVDSGLYKECGPFLETERTIETNISALRIGKEVEESFAGLEDSPPPLAESMYRERITRLVALLALNDRTFDAQVAMNQCLEELDSERFRAELAAALNGHLPTKESRDQA